MKINELVETIKVTTLSNLTIKSDDNIIKLLINLGLVEIYSMFGLNKTFTDITLTKGNNLITLPDDCDTVSAIICDNDKYMINTDYQDILIEQTSVNTLRVLNNLNYTQAVLEYYTKAPHIEDISSTDPVPLPDSLLLCLNTFIGYQAHISLNSELKDENNAYYMRYIAAINSVSKYKHLAINRAEVGKHLDRRVF